MDREAWWATVHGVAKSWTQLSDFISLFKLCVHAQLLSCVQLFEMPWTEEPGGLQSTGSQRVGHD